MSRKPVSIKAARKKKQVNPLHKPLSYWQELLPGWTGLEYCNQYHTINLSEGNDWKPYGWESTWDIIIDKLRPGVRAAALELAAKGQAT